MSDEIPSSGNETASNGFPVLTFAETRVLGCLLEKEATTPDHYPLTFNSLHSACNQSSNRDPVTDLGTDEVEEAMEGLRYKKLSMLVHQAALAFELWTGREVPYGTMAAALSPAQ